ncbi:MAG: 6,7-dimethyl-8-ribityllumazine synthase [Bacteroidia bacterium]|nr:6,7-dimethyl-8-ribityllumazine synthase [Bacteroidia bacterium]
MATKLKNLSDHNIADIPSAKGMGFGIVVSEWNSEITESMSKAAIETLMKYGAKEKQIIKKYVPGSFELTMGAQFLAEYTDVDAVICIGCVIQGETRHFDFICQGVTSGITNLNMKYGMPFIYGLLTTNTLEQAKDRAGGKHGNKGVEAAVTAIKMLALEKSLK